MEGQYSRGELEQAADAVRSLLHKLAKSKESLEAKGAIRSGSAQQTLIDRRIAALKISADLIEDALAVTPPSREGV